MSKRRKGLKKFGAFATGILLILTVLLFHGTVQAGLMESYIARLSTDDHFNSRGERLTSAAAIIRQDRANFHKFGIRDPEDTDDNFFTSAENRAALERFLKRGVTTKAAYREIVNGTPLIKVEIYWTGSGNYVDVRIIEFSGGTEDPLRRGTGSIHE